MLGQLWSNVEAAVGAPVDPHEAPAPAAFESMGWFQAMLNELWPLLRRVLEKDVLRGALEPQLAAWAPALRLSGASLGDDRTPPQLRGARTVPGRHALQVMFDIGFHPGPKIDISLAVGPLSSPIAAIRDFSLRGRLCVCLVGLVPRMPVVSGIKVFFANVPDLSFSLSGVPAALPVSAQKLKEFVLQAISDQMVPPRALNMHLDSPASAVSEPNFLAYHQLHSPPAEGILRVVLVGVDGLILAHAKVVYAVLRVGRCKQTTEPIQEGTRRLGWPSRAFNFVVDFLVDQDLQLEIYNKDTSSMLMSLDKLLGQTRISIAELAQELRRSAVVRLPLHLALRPDSHVGATGSAIVELAGAFMPLVSTPPVVEEGLQWFLQVVVDCVVGLGDASHGRRFFVRGMVLPDAIDAGARRVPPQALAPKTAERAQVAKARMMAATFDDLRLAGVKERLRLLHKRGVKLTPEEVAWLFPGMVAAKDAARLMEELQKEEKDEVVGPTGVEVLFEDQLRFEVCEPRHEGLRIELVDEAANVTVGLLEWSSLEWLAGSAGLEDEMQAYNLDRQGLPLGSGASPSGGHVPRIYLKRALRHLAPGLGGAHRGRVADAWGPAPRLPH